MPCWKMLGGPFIRSFFLEPKGPISSGTQIHPVAARCTKDLLSDSLLRHPDYLSILSDSQLEIFLMNLLGGVIILSTTRTVWWSFYLFAHIVPATVGVLFDIKGSTWEISLAPVEWFSSFRKGGNQTSILPSQRQAKNRSRINHPKTDLWTKLAESKHLHRIEILVVLESQDTDMWSEWLLLSFRNEMLLPVLLQACIMWCDFDTYKIKITLQRLVFGGGGATMEFITIESSSLWKMFGTSFGASLK